MQSEMYDYDSKTKIKCTTMQTDAARQKNIGQVMRSSPKP